MCFLTAAASFKKRREMRKNLRINQLICSLLLGASPFRFTHGMVIICLTLGSSAVLGGSKIKTTNPKKNGLLDGNGSYTEKFWKNSPAHLAKTMMSYIYKPLNVLGVLCVLSFCILDSD